MWHTFAVKSRNAPAIQLFCPVLVWFKIYLELLNCSKPESFWHRTARMKMAMIFTQHASWTFQRLQTEALPIGDLRLLCGSENWSPWEKNGKFNTSLMTFERNIEVLSSNLEIAWTIYGLDQFSCSGPQFSSSTRATTAISLRGSSGEPSARLRASCKCWATLVGGNVTRSTAVHIVDTLRPCCLLLPPSPASTNTTKKLAVEVIHTFAGLHATRLENVWHSSCPWSSLCSWSWDFIPYDFNKQCKIGFLYHKEASTTLRI